MDNYTRGVLLIKLSNCSLFSVVKQGESTADSRSYEHCLRTNVWFVTTKSRIIYSKPPLNQTLTRYLGFRLRCEILDFCKFRENRVCWIQTGIIRTLSDLQTRSVANLAPMHSIKENGPLPKRAVKHRARPTSFYNDSGLYTTCISIFNYSFFKWS